MVQVIQSAHQRTKGDVSASMMIEGFGGEPMVDDSHRLVGIVTEFDLLSALDSGTRLDDLAAQSDVRCVNGRGLLHRRLKRCSWPKPWSSRPPAT